MLGLQLPEDAGREGFDPVTAEVVYEELGRGDVGLAMLVMVENLVTKLCWEYGDEAQREVVREIGREYLPYDR